VPAGRSSSTLHALNRRILAEDLIRVRRPDDRERYSASQRQARVDPNPHQIDAVIFALRRQLAMISRAPARFRQACSFKRTTRSLLLKLSI